MCETWKCHENAPLRLVIRKDVAKVDKSGIPDANNSSWKLLNPDDRQSVGRKSSENIFRRRSGVKAKYIREISSPVDAFKLFIDNRITQILLENTNVEAADLTMTELSAFIGLQYARGLYGKNKSVDFLWSREFGSRLFCNVMTRNRFNDIKRCIRFDEKTTRTSRKSVDPFAPIRDVFELFAENCRSVYAPHFSLTIDEQLMPLKSRCRFITFMPNKPDKFGIKFWMLVDAQSKYVYNILPYLGAVEKELKGNLSLAEDVVERLMLGLFNKGYNITTDNYFTSMKLAKSLRWRKTTIVGTVRNNKKEIPVELKNQSLERFESNFYWNESDNQLLVRYQTKKNKYVIVLSTIHNSCDVTESLKRKPAPICFYNKNKCGVDIVDNMLRMYSTRCATRRWPPAVWQNILDIALFNSWICYCQASGANISRKQFLMKVISQLTYVGRNENPLIGNADLFTHHSLVMERRKCSGGNCYNKVSTLCSSCKTSLCGTCCAVEAPKIRWHSKPTNLTENSRIWQYFKGVWTHLLDTHPVDVTIYI